MKQIKILGVLALALSLGLSACGGKKSSSTPASSSVPVSSSQAPASSSQAPSSTVAPVSSSEAPVESSEISSEAPVESSEAPVESSSEAPVESSSEAPSTSSKHVHTYAEEWTWNDTNHWHAATCEHTSQKSGNAKHEFENIEAPADKVAEQPNVAPTCTEKGHQWVKCTVCGAEVYQDVKAAGHTYVELAPEADTGDLVLPEGEAEADHRARPATCQKAGIKVEICSVCGDRKESELAILDHTFAKDENGEDVVVWAQEANCTEAGSGVKTCTVCGTEVPVTTEALGHSWGEWEELVAPTCEGKGSHKHVCTRCGAEETEDVDPLGHDIEAVGGETTPTDGTAAVRLYHCKRCDQTYMGFAANEVTDESKAHVAFEPETVEEGQEQGARFLGRPIGNALALDASGTSVNQQNGECVYCSTETGDFIEYAFRLNAEQAATLASCRMYCDAQPASYLNGTDFWAYGRSNDEWTPGFYIDGGDERFETNEDGTFQMVKDHARAGFDSQPGAELETEVKLGKRIEDYRYVLYVDDEVKDFDPTTENPTHGSNQNMQREEFVLPYTFNLHEGLNKIKFVMAGGYRSLFYKCIFRPYVEPTPVTVNETAIEVREGKTAQITSTMEGLSFKSSSNSVCTVDATGLVTGVKAGTAQITVSKEGNYKDVKVPVTVLPPEGNILLDLAAGVKAPEDATIDDYTSGSSGFWFRNPKQNGTLTYTFQSELAGKFDLKFGLRGSNIVLADNMAIKVNGVDVALEGTVNTSYSAVEYVIGQADLVKGENTMVITFLADSSLYMKSIQLIPHVYQDIQAWGCDEIFPTLTGTGWADPKDFGDAGKAFKFNKVGGFTVSYESASAQKVLLKLKIAVKQSNNAKTGFWAQSGEAEVKTRITVNGNVVTPGAEPDFTGSTASSVNDSGIISVPEWYNIIEIDLVEGENTITVEYVAGGYSYYVGGIAIAK